MLSKLSPTRDLNNGRNLENNPYLRDVDQLIQWCQQRLVSQFNFYNKFVFNFVTFCSQNFYKQPGDQICTRSLPNLNPINLNTEPTTSFTQKFFKLNGKSQTYREMKRCYISNLWINWRKFTPNFWVCLRNGFAIFTRFTISSQPRPMNSIGFQHMNKLR